MTRPVRPSSRQTLVRATALVTGLTVGSKVMGFIRGQIVALFFGATGHTDAIVVAQTLPTLLSGVVLSAIGTAFSPVLSERLSGWHSARRPQRCRRIYGFSLGGQPDVLLQIRPGCAAWVRRSQS